MKKIHKRGCCTWSRKALYLAIVSGLLIALAYEVALCIRKFVSEPTYYESHLERQRDTEFPDITLCPYFDNVACLDAVIRDMLNSNEWKYLKCGLRGKLSEEWHKKLSCNFFERLKSWGKARYYFPPGYEEHYPSDWKQEKKLPPCLEEIHDFQSDNHFLACENEPKRNLTYRDFIVSNYTMDKFVSSITVKTRSGSGVKDLWLPVFEKGKADESIIKIKSHWTPKYGTCHTLNFTDKIRRKGISKVDIIKKNEFELGNHINIMAALHGPDTFHLEDARKDIFLQCHAVQYYIDYEVKIEKQFKNGHLNCENYDFDFECVEKKFKNHIQTLTSENCTLPNTGQSIPMCRNPDDMKIALDEVKRITEIDIHNCTKVCLTMPMTFIGGQVNSRSGRPSLNLRFQPWISTAVERDLYTWGSLGAEIGGYVGIMVGYSILNLAEFLISLLKKKVGKEVDQTQRKPQRDHFSELKILVHLICLAVLSYWIWKCFEKYLEGPTIYDTKNLQQSKAEFPDITICNTEVGGLHKLKLLDYCNFSCGQERKYCGDSWNGLNWNKRLSIDCNQSQPDDPLILFNNASYELEKIVSQITVKTRRDSTKRDVLNWTQIDASFMSIFEQRSKSHGKCYTIRFAKIIRDAEISWIRIERRGMMTGGVTKVALHNIDTFHQEDMRKDFEFDDFSIEYYVDYQVRIAKERIREDKVTCKEDYNFDTECVYNKFDEISESTTTHCTVPWARNNSNICTKIEDTNKAHELAEKIVNIDLHECPSWCQSMPMRFSGGGTSKGGLAGSLTLNFQPIITLHTEKYLYTFLNLFAEVGGYVGIMVGYSLMTLTDTLYDICKSK